MTLKRKLHNKIAILLLSFFLFSLHSYSQGPQQKKYVLHYYQERQQQNKEADVRALEVAKGVVEETERRYEKNMKSGMLKNTSSIWEDITFQEVAERLEENKKNKQQVSVEKTELNRNKIWNIYTI